MPELLASARRTSKVYGISDYSAASGKLRGDGYVLVGDAATFLDPVFSTGVFLALTPIALLCAFIAWVSFTLLTRYVSVGSIASVRQA